MNKITFSSILFQPLVKEQLKIARIEDQSWRARLTTREEMSGNRTALVAVRKTQLNKSIPNMTFSPCAVPKTCQNQKIINIGIIKSN